MDALGADTVGAGTVGTGTVLVTGAGGGVGGVGRTVVELLRERSVPVRALVHHDDERAETLRGWGAEVVVGDLTRPDDVAGALAGCRRMFFNMSVSPAYLEATATVATVARAVGTLDTLVAMSQMTVSQMTAVSTEESHQQRLHWLSEQVLDWSGLPVRHLRPTVFLDNPLFTVLAARSIADDATIRLPFGRGRTSPVAASDVARVAAELLTDPAAHRAHVYELTGPRSQDMDGVAAEFSRALGRPVTYVDVPPDEWVNLVATQTDLAPFTRDHIVTMARLHRQNRYDRATTTVEQVTGRPARGVAEFVAERAGLVGHPLGG
ncbi:NAD(P)H-binding protein [Parafrankia discariae]|uniref:NAD(P)H-binding protein n=1 Tax=Parafrankia discariae TaxID=365528 RepID=UPI0003688438|nr:NAD(P)H-binding protein [Parafrankia discariae]